MTTELDQGAFYARLSRYYELLDKMEQLEALRAMFSQDGVWEIFGPGADHPILAFDPVDRFFEVAAAQAPIARAARWRHHLTGMHTRAEGEAMAISWVKVLVTEQPDAEKPPAFRETAVLDCRWIREDGEWRIARLSIRPDGATGVSG